MNSNPILKQNEAIVRKLLAINLSALTIVFFIGGALIYNYLSFVENMEINRAYKSVEGLVLEGVLAYESDGESGGVYRKIAQGRLDNVFASNNLRVKAWISPCENSANAKLLRYELNLGSSKLANCVFLENKSNLLPKLVAALVAAFLFAISLPFIFWKFYKNRLNERILIPLINDLELKKVDAALGELAQKIAHDIRSPLAVLEIAASNKVEMTKDEMSSLISQSIVRIRQIAYELLDKGRESNKFSVAPSPEVLKLRHIIDNAITEIKIVFSAKKIVFTVDVPEPIGIVKSSETAELFQIIVNLLTNSCESIVNNGRIEIRASGSSEYLNIVIKDDGIGIPASILQNVGNKGITSKDNGNGLAIFNSRKFAKRFGGDITLKPSNPIGTECLISFSSAELIAYTD